LWSAVIGAAIEAPLAICLINSRHGIDNASAAAMVCLTAHLPAVLLLGGVVRLISSASDPAWPQALAFFTQGFIFSMATWIVWTVREKIKSR
jgi:hypothetical protein